MAKELLYMDDIWIRYLTLPELSVEGFQANVTLVWVIAVVCRLVGVVGGVLSLAARTGDGLRSNTSTVSTAAARAVNIGMYHLFIFSPRK
jgi:hypothetical protein